MLPKNEWTGCSMSTKPVFIFFMGMKKYKVSWWLANFDLTESKLGADRKLLEDCTTWHFHDDKKKTRQMFRVQFRDALMITHVQYRRCFCLHQSRCLCVRHLFYVNIWAKNMQIVGFFLSVFKSVQRCKNVENKAYFLSVLSFYVSEYDKKNHLVLTMF